MAKYVYPAIFTPEKSGGYSICIPDIPGCYTSGKNLTDGIYKANDALCLMMYDIEERGAEIPAASNIVDLKTEPGEFPTLIACDTIEYRKFYDSHAVKKTLSIPAWLNTLAERENVNFSAVLQQALKEYLHI